MIHDQIRQYLLTRIPDYPTTKYTGLAQLRQSEWSYEFECYMCNKLLGSEKYRGKQILNWQKKQKQKKK